MVSVFIIDRQAAMPIFSAAATFLQPIGHPDSRHLGACFITSLTVLRSRLMICRMSLLGLAQRGLLVRHFQSSGNLHRSGCVAAWFAERCGEESRRSVLAIRIMGG